MSVDHEHGADDRFSRILAAYDDALAAGQTAENDGASTLDGLEPEALRELYAAQACLRLLEQKWPRSPGAVPESDKAPPELSFFAFNDLARHLGRFEIQRKLGQGGFGVVFLAFDSVLRRLVALKLPRPDTYLTPAMQERFLKEARAAAALKHSHIVAVHDAGQAGPLCYIAEAYCEGPTLSSWLKQQTEPVAPRLAAEVIGTLAEAVAYAHSRGIVHRDLKPGNVLLEPKPARRDDGQAGGADDFDFVPKLTDFGMARLPGTDTVQTTTAALGGTAPYMAPEQVEGRTSDVGPATDVYALGATLYELLAGRTPFHGDTAVEILHRVVSEDPARLRSFRLDVPRDLEAICLKCLEKEPHRRYTSADALAADLRRFLAGEPIHARPVSPAGRARKWVRRRPALAALLAVSLLATLGLLGGTMWHAARLKSALDVTEQMRLEAEELRESALQQQARAQDRERRVRQFLYAGDMRLAYVAWKNHHVAEMVDLLARHQPAPGEEDARSFVWHYLWRLCHGELRTLAGHIGDVHCVVFSPDGQRLATASQDGTARLWDVVTGSELAILQGHQGELNSVAFSPDGKTLATCGDDRTVRLWDTASGRMQTTLLGHTDAVYSLSFSPDGKTLVSGGREHTIRLWDISTGKESAALAGHKGGIEAVAFSPDGKLLATASGDQTAIIWDVATQKPRTQLVGFGQIVLAVAFSHDGRTLATGGEDRTITLWDVGTGQQKAAFKGHGEIVQCLAFSADDQTIAAAVKDGSAWLWEMQTGRVRRTLRGHSGRVWFVAYSPDGKSLATAGGDRTVKLWNPDLDQEMTRITGFSAPVNSISFAPDGNGLAVGLESRESQPAEPSKPDGTPERRIFARYGKVSLARSGKFMALATYDNHVELYELPGWHIKKSIEATRADGQPHSSGFNCIAWSPDNRTVATVLNEDGRIVLIDTEEGREMAVIARPQADRRPKAIGFSTDGALLAAGDHSGELTLWKSHDLKERKTMRAHAVGIWGLAFSPDGSLLATASSDGTVKVWDLDRLEERATLQGHAGPVRSVAFCFDNRTVASAGDDGTVRLWDIETWQELLALEAQKGGARHVAFSPDGRTLVSGGAAESGSGEVAIWSARQGPPP